MSLRAKLRIRRVGAARKITKPLKWIKLSLSGGLWHFVQAIAQICMQSNVHCFMVGISIHIAVVNVVYN